MPERPPPSRCFWELTRACDHECLHCRMRAGEPGSQELDCAQALDVADQLVALRVPRVVLTGGEPLLCDHWETVARRLAGGGIEVGLFTSGPLLDAATIVRARKAGIARFVLSLDGPRGVHDRLRQLRRGGGSSFDGTLAAVRLLVADGLPVRLVTTVTAPGLASLAETGRIVRHLGVRRWQVQLCRAAGRARDRAAGILPQPEDLEAILAVLVETALQGEVEAPLHCSIGYLVEEEAALRRPASRSRPVWDGADAGIRTMAIDPEGGVRGCVCLPEEFVTASLRSRSLSHVWADDECFPYSRLWDPGVLSGDCAACALARICRAGCPSVAWGATGTIGANPYCLRLVRGRVRRG